MVVRDLFALISRVILVRVFLHRFAGPFWYATFPRELSESFWFVFFFCRLLDPFWYGIFSSQFSSVSFLNWFSGSFFYSMYFPSAFSVVLLCYILVSGFRYIMVRIFFRPFLRLF